MTDEGYNILMIANSRKETKRSFQQMKGTVLRKLKNERLQQVNDEYLSSLKGEGSPSIEVDDSKLLAIEVQSRPNLSMRPGLDLQRGGDEDKTRAPQPGPETPPRATLRLRSGAR